jgi:hypothetical protein
MYYTTPTELRDPELVAYRLGIATAQRVRAEGGNNDDVYETVVEALAEEGCYDSLLIEQVAQQVEEETDPDMEV